MTGPDRPTILISRAEDVAGERWEDYAEAVVLAGGDPVPIDAGDFLEAAALPAHDGIVITAGVDIDPARYGQERSERVLEIDPARDEFEEALIAHALGSDVPLFAICRGAQLFNTSQGGSLLQHIEQREPHRARRAEDGAGARDGIESGWHEVAVAPGTLLERVTGASALWVNSRHHQAILREQIAPGLIASGIAPDGIVEAVESPDATWALGVQWHPEQPEMLDSPDCRDGSIRLFEEFVAACIEVAARREERT
jgi:putative glutamine amidotransferase